MQATLSSHCLNTAVLHYHCYSGTPVPYKANNMKLMGLILGISGAAVLTIAVVVAVTVYTKKKNANQRPNSVGPREAWQ